MPIPTAFTRVPSFENCRGGISLVSVIYDPASIAAGAELATTVTVPGTNLGDVCIAAHSQIGANDLHITAGVSAVDTVRVLLGNPSAGAIDLASGTLNVLVFHVGN